MSDPVLVGVEAEVLVGAVLVAPTTVGADLRGADLRERAIPVGHATVVVAVLVNLAVAVLVEAVAELRLLTVTESVEVLVPAGGAETEVLQGSVTLTTPLVGVRQVAGTGVGALRVVVEVVTPADVVGQPLVGEANAIRAIVVRETTVLELGLDTDPVDDLGRVTRVLRLADHGLADVLLVADLVVGAVFVTEATTALVEVLFAEEPVRAGVGSVGAGIVHAGLLAIAEQAVAAFLVGEAAAGAGGVCADTVDDDHVVASVGGVAGDLEAGVVHCAELAVGTVFIGETITALVRLLVTEEPIGTRYVQGRGTNVPGTNLGTVAEVAVLTLSVVEATAGTSGVCADTVDDDHVVASVGGVAGDLDARVGLACLSLCTVRVLEALALVAVVDLAGAVVVHSVANLDRINVDGDVVVVTVRTGDDTGILRQVVTSTIHVSVLHAVRGAVELGGAGEGIDVAVVAIVDTKPGFASASREFSRCQGLAALPSQIGRESVAVLGGRIAYEKPVRVLVEGLEDDGHAIVLTGQTAGQGQKRDEQSDHEGRGDGETGDELAHEKTSWCALESSDRVVDEFADELCERSLCETKIISQNDLSLFIK